MGRRNGGRAGKQNYQEELPVLREDEGKSSDFRNGHEASASQNKCDERWKYLHESVQIFYPDQHQVIELDSMGVLSGFNEYPRQMQITDLDTLFTFAVQPMHQWYHTTWLDIRNLTGLTTSAVGYPCFSREGQPPAITRELQALKTYRTLAEGACYFGDTKRALDLFQKEADYTLLFVLKLEDKCAKVLPYDPLARLRVLFDILGTSRRVDQFRHEVDSAWTINSRSDQPPELMSEVAAVAETVDCKADQPPDLIPKIASDQDTSDSKKDQPPESIARAAPVANAIGSENHQLSMSSPKVAPVEANSSSTTRLSHQDHYDVDALGASDACKHPSAHRQMHTNYAKPSTLQNKPIIIYNVAAYIEFGSPDLFLNRWSLNRQVENFVGDIATPKPEARDCIASNSSKNGSMSSSVEQFTPSSGESEIDFIFHVPDRLKRSNSSKNGSISSSVELFRPSRGESPTEFILHVPDRLKRPRPRARSVPANQSTAADSEAENSDPEEGNSQGPARSATISESGLTSIERDESFVESVRIKWKILVARYGASSTWIWGPEQHYAAREALNSPGLRKICGHVEPFEHQGDKYESISHDGSILGFEDLTRETQLRDLAFINATACDHRCAHIFKTWSEIRQITGTDVSDWRRDVTQPVASKQMLLRSKRAIKTFNALGEQFWQSGPVRTALELFQKEADYVLLLLLQSHDEEVTRFGQERLRVLFDRLGTSRHVITLPHVVTIDYTVPSIGHMIRESDLVNHNSHLPTPMNEKKKPKSKWVILKTNPRVKTGQSPLSKATPTSAFALPPLSSSSTDTAFSDNETISEKDIGTFGTNKVISSTERPAKNLGFLNERILSHFWGGHGATR